MAVNCNPIVDGKYKWGNVTLTMNDDLSVVTITGKDGQEVVVSGSFFADVFEVLSAYGTKDTDAFFNTIRTSRSLPTCGWD